MEFTRELIFPFQGLDESAYAVCLVSVPRIIEYCIKNATSLRSPLVRRTKHAERLCSDDLGHPAQVLGCRAKARQDGRKHGGSIRLV